MDSVVAALRLVNQTPPYPRAKEVTVANDLQIDQRLTIPGREIVYRMSRSSGPGGQHVNTADTRVELRWNIRHSAVLTPAQRLRLEQTLASRINRRGELVLSSGKRRSQHQNRQAVATRLVELVRRALQPRRRRRRTQPTAATKEKRLREKRRRAEQKRLRRPPDPTD